jgi:predicted DsbA family dithiol-disulfide isomerase
MMTDATQAQWKSDFVSDVVCPWCVIGLRGVELALAQIADVAAADIHVHPFELNPDMAAEGENVGEHIAAKYGATREQMAGNRQAMRDRAAALGFTMTGGADSRIWNTFDAHRLLHWAGTLGNGAALRLKHALFAAHFTEGRNIADQAVLSAVAGEAGLPVDAAAEVLASGRYADDVRSHEAHWRSAGITSVPTLIINDKYLISGGQPPEIFAKALRRIAAEVTTEQAASAAA